MGDGTSKPKGLAAEVLAQPCGKNQLRRGEADFTPTDRDLAMYRDYAAGLGQEAICKHFKITKTLFYRRVKYVSDWVRDELIGDIQALRAQQTMLLMGHYRELKEIWDHNRVDRSAEEVPKDARGAKRKPAANTVAKDPKRRKKSPDGTPVIVDQPLLIMHHMVSVLDSVAKINGLHKINVNVSQEEDTEERVAGIPRSVVILRQIEQLRAAYESEQGHAAGATAADAAGRGNVIDAELIGSGDDDSIGSGGIDDYSDDSDDGDGDDDSGE